MMQDMFAGAESFRLEKFQLINWGTFSGLVNVEISPKGHLFVGGSGSGKSTLLDAMSVLLSPKASNFNAAAQQGAKRSDRSFVSYLRGAWGTGQDDEGKAAVKYLRPDTTFSAIAMTYRSTMDSMVTLLFIGTLRGNTREEAAVKKNYFVIPGAFDLEALTNFPASNFDLRMVKQANPEAQSFNSFSAYAETLMKYFQIRDVKVLELLHKAQSAKNMGDINQFFRDFMLEKPKTYEEADLLVLNFSRLREAYELVKKARRKVEILSKARTHHESYLEAEESISKFSSWEEEIPIWKNLQIKGLLDKSIPKQRGECEAIKEKIRTSESKREEIEAQIQDLQLSILQNGGAALERLELRLKETSRHLAETERKIIKLKPALSAVKMQRPESADGWEQQKNELADKQKAWEEESRLLTEERDEANFKLRTAGEELQRLKKEIEIMRRQPSNIPGRLLEIRDKAAEELGLSPADLPFAGELLQILPGQEKWRGACERVLNQFAMSLLVSEKNYADLARWVDGRNLGIRLVYLRAKQEDASPVSLEKDSVPTKFEVKSGVWKKWVEADLSRRFNYVCVENTSEFGAYEKAVTINGQIKHNRVRHEKDDRRSILDAASWVTGFDNTEKRREFEKRAQALAETIAELLKHAEETAKKSASLAEALGGAKELSKYDWTDWDTATDKAEMMAITEQIEKIKEAGGELTKLKAQKELTEQKKKQLEHEISGLNQELGESNRKLKVQEEQEQEVLEFLKDKIENSENEEALSQLDSELHPRSGLSLNNINTRSTDISKELGQRITQNTAISSKALADRQKEFENFLRAWPNEYPELDTSERSTPEFFEILRQLEEDGLQEFERKFLELLENHTKQNLVNLCREIDNEKRDIKARLKEVNESLKEAVFNRQPDFNTHLEILIKDRRLPECEDFRKLQTEIMRPESEEFSLEEAEHYYQDLSQLVTRLDSRSTEFKLWRERVLDVRQHVEFRGLELGPEGQEIDVYDSDSGKSGGQRQKLTMTCLVAALRYQLGGRKEMLPSYAPVIMDEAFDKADSEFTDISMRIFHDFGFQPIIATPEKALYTLEPYVGSFTFVSCENRNNSSVVSVTPERIHKAVADQTERNYEIPN